MDKLTPGEWLVGDYKGEPYEPSFIGEVGGSICFADGLFPATAHRLAQKHNLTVAERDEARRQLAEAKAGWLEMAHRFSCLLDHATGGRMSKTNYTKEAMYAEVDDHISDLGREQAEEEGAELRRDLAEAAQAVRLLIEYERAEIVGDVDGSHGAWHKFPKWLRRAIER